MIDINHQNKEYGKVALKKFLEFFNYKYPKGKLYTSVEIDNELVINLYKNQGFKKKEYFEYTMGKITYKEFRMIKEEW